MRVSLVIPTFNRSEMLRELLVSVVAQSHRPVEVVIIDDASTDNTADVVREFFAQQSHDDSLSHSYERLEGQSGAPVARNRGVALAQGDAAMFVDSDDLLASNGLQELAWCLGENTGLSYAYGKVAITRDRLEESFWSGVVGGDFGTMPVEIFGYHWHTMGALYRRSCIERVGPWNEELTGSQDWEYQARVKLLGGAGRFVDTLVGYWRQYDSGRVGACRFRPDYVESVMKACALILDQAKEAGKCDHRLEYKLAKRLVVHALEWGGNGYRLGRQRCLHQALDTAPSAFLLSAAIRLYALCPSAFDRAALRVVHRIQQRA
jgi:glycosyltransferase involved in cell wall biosynthesis